MNDVDACPCGTGQPFADCCRRLHRGGVAATAEALMRSRYAAFVVGDTDYLLRTWHPSTRPARLDLDTDRTWKRLVITDTDAGALFHRTGTVSFAAHYERGGRRGMQAETSRFVRDGEQWFYVDGDVASARS